MEPGQITISLYENSVPSFVEPELEVLYEHVFSSMPQFRVYDGIDGNTHTYVAQNSGKTTAVLLFRCVGNKVQVLNEQISMDAEEIDRFCRYVFDTWPAVDMVTFRAIRSGPKPLAFPHQQFYRTEDIVLRLPLTADEYLNSLSKATRKNFKYYSNRLRRNFPTLRYVLLTDGDIPDQHVRDIIELNRARMAAKNKESEMSPADADRLIRLVQQCGLVSVMMLDGRVVAGTVCSRVGANYFMHVNAHDPVHNDARIGRLCCYMTICDCIGRGGKEFHFMWGRFEYKYALLGVQQDFDELIAYRSHARMLRNGGSVLRTAFDGYAREWKFKLLDLADSKEGGGFLTRVAIRALNLARNLKRSGFGLAGFRQ